MKKQMVKLSDLSINMPNERTKQYTWESWFISRAFPGNTNRIYKREKYVKAWILVEQQNQQDKPRFIKPILKKLHKEKQ